MPSPLPYFQTCPLAWSPQIDRGSPPAAALAPFLPVDSSALFGQYYSAPDVFESGVSEVTQDPPRRQSKFSKHPFRVPNPRFYLVHHIDDGYSSLALVQFVACELVQLIVGGTQT
jgi:hypothetical protein